jgi:hypothetical protein
MEKASAETRGSPDWSMPPARRMRPSGSSVAAWARRPTIAVPDGANESLVGSQTSASRATDDSRIGWQQGMPSSPPPATSSRKSGAA